MAHTIDILLPPEQAADREALTAAAAQRLGIPVSAIRAVRVERRSIDARRRPPLYQLRVSVFTEPPPPERPPVRERYRRGRDRRVVIVGAGPAGYFAALECLEYGLIPVVVDRGKDVQARRRDLRRIQQFGEVDPDSNYCFGEGGAGTYSDGKLYTRSHKRGNIRKILDILVDHGAPGDILVDAHPHIGSNKLPKVVAGIRDTILEFGGEIHFETRVADLILEDGCIRGVVSAAGDEFTGDAVVLATGHSARDIFHLLHRRGIAIAAKPFAMGVRVEHPQPLIDRIQYGKGGRMNVLPPAAYRLACQVDDRGVFSFCMCPGGWIVPASTAPGELVINGMSLSKRDNEFANSGIVVSVEMPDLAPFGEHGPLAGLMFQKAVEEAAFRAGGDDTQRAPAQRLLDFIAGRESTGLGPTSYIPGVHPAPLHDILPPAIAGRLRDGFRQFGRRMKGFLSEDAQVLAVESRTSSPVRIPRDDETFEHPEVAGLYPCGEGAGYAGGIVSAALDGQNVLRAVAKRLGVRPAAG